MERDPTAVTRDRIATETGTHPPYVSKAPMWAAFAAKKKAEANLQVREVALTDEMLASVPGCDAVPGELDELIAEQAEERARDDSYPEHCNSRRNAT